MKPGALISPVPAVMVSCGRGAEKNIITIAWTGIINSQPPMTYISVRKSRHSHSIIAREKDFVINLTTEDVDKFRETGLTPQPAEMVKCPMIGESPLNLECKVVEIRQYPTHDMFVAQIVKVHVSEGIMDKDGRIALERAGLLAYAHGHYFGLKQKPIGRFGFSVMKKKTKKRLAAKRTARTAGTGPAGPEHHGKIR